MFILPRRPSLTRAIRVIREEEEEEEEEEEDKKKIRPFKVGTLWIRQ